MGDALNRSVTTTSHQYVLHSPTNAVEVGKAVAWAERDLIAAKGQDAARWDDAITFTCQDDELIISWAEETQ